jgi:lipopolysaccharide transport system permease protein
MAGSVNRSLNSVLGNAGLLKKIYIPKYIFTLATVTSEFIIFLFSLGAFVIIAIITKVPFSGSFFLIIIPTVQLYIFSLGLGLFMAQATVFFRDMVHIWSIFSTGWMFLSVIFYPVAILPEQVRFIVTHFNPMYFYITMFRNFTIGVEADVLDLVIRGTVAAGAMFLLGFVTFSYSKNKFILYM